MAEVSNTASWISRNKILVIVLSTIVVAAGVGVPLYFVFANKGTYTDVTVQEATDMINDDETYPDLVIIDVRSAFEFAGGHIPDAINVPWVSSDFNGGEYVIESYKDTEILVYCQSGYRSKKASQYLANHGFTKIYNMIEGYPEWLAIQPIPPEVINIDVHIAKSMIDDNVTYPDLIVVDIRLDFEYISRHLIDSIWLAWNSTEGNYNGNETQLAGYEDTEIIVYCNSGNRSIPGSQFFIDIGFTKIYNMGGGIVAWEGAGYNTTTT